MCVCVCAYVYSNVYAYIYIEQIIQKEIETLPSCWNTKNNGIHIKVFDKFATINIIFVGISKNLIFFL